MRKVDELTRTAGTSWQIPLVVRVNEYSNEPQEVEVPTLILPVKANFSELHSAYGGATFLDFPHRSVASAEHELSNRNRPSIMSELPGLPAMSRVGVVARRVMVSFGDFLAARPHLL